MDLLAAIIALFAVRIAGKTADVDHPFEHGKVENVSAFVEALLIFLAAIWIIYEPVPAAAFLLRMSSGQHVININHRH
jgi:divalent metal cation (Fe/Co/Zn/Cd) transporter